MTEPMELLELAGQIIMENGGETFRVEETVTRMGRAFGLKNVESFAIPSGVFVSYRREDGTTETGVVRIRRKGTNLTSVDVVNAISRQVEAGELSPEETLAKLKQLEQHRPELPGWLIVLGAAVTGSGFSLMFGGTALDCVSAFLAAGIVQLICNALDRQHVNGLFTSLLGSFVCTLLPTLMYVLTGLGHVDLIVGGALMPLLPGLSMTNAVQDTLRGDMVSGSSHLLQATLTAALVAGGALVATSLCRLLGGIKLW